jgi:hypothetical protein
VTLLISEELLDHWLVLWSPQAEGGITDDAERDGDWNALEMVPRHDAARCQLPTCAQEIDWYVRRLQCSAVMDLTDVTACVEQATDTRMG